MPAHRHRLAPPHVRPRLCARPGAVARGRARCSAGCGGKDEEPKASKKDDDEPRHEPSASASAARGGRTRPRLRRTAGRAVLPDVARRSRWRLGDEQPAGQRAAAAHHRRRARRLRAEGRHRQDPARRTRRAIGKRLCEPAYRKLAGGTVADRATSLLTWTLFTPSSDQLERGARWVRCDVLARSGESAGRAAGQQAAARQGRAGDTARVPDRRPAPTSPARDRTPSGSRPCTPHRAAPTPTPTATPPPPGPAARS